MTRRQWMWLWIWLLLFFIIFCVWNKLLAHKHQEHAVETKPVIMTGQNKKSVPAQQPKRKDILLKITKDGNIIKLSGVFPSQQALEKAIEDLKSAGAPVEKGTIIIDKNADNERLRNAIPAFARDLKKFSTGIIEYREHKLTVDGLVKDAGVKEDLNRIMATLGKEYRTENLVTVAKAAEKKRAPEKKISSTPATAQKTETTHKSVMPEEQNKSVVSAGKHETTQQQKKNAEKTQTTAPAMNKSESTLTTAKNAKEDAQKRLNKILKGKRIQFLYAKETLTPKSKRLLDQIAHALQEYPSIRIEIAGYTDSDGSRERNLKLSQRRAQSVKSYLVNKGIAPSRLVARGYGESHPLVKNDTPAHKQRNRRVEFKVINQKERI